jgi:ABC-type glutathione transport system ATPase component
LGTLTLHHHIVIGLLFIVVVVFAPKGIVGILCTKLKERTVTMNLPVLQAKNLSKNFLVDLRAVANVNFEVAPLGVTSIIGPNGAGKATLSNLAKWFIYSRCRQSY